MQLIIAGPLFKPDLEARLDTPKGIEPMILGERCGGEQRVLDLLVPGAA